MSQAMTLFVSMMLFISCPDNNTLTQSEKNGLTVAFWGPYLVSTSVYDSRDLVVEAVYQATTLSGGAAIGRVVKTGTLQPGIGGIQYLPYPEDRLLVKMDKDVHEFVVKDAQGNNMAATAMDWLSAPHILKYTHKLKGKAEAEISVQFDGMSFKVGVKGWSWWSKTRYVSDLTITGKTQGEGDYHGQEIKTNYQIKGKITSDDLVIEVNEQRSYEMASATSLRLLYSQRGSSSRIKAALNNKVQTKNGEYVLKNVKAQFDSKTKGGQTQAGLTHVQGEVLKGGKPFGKCVLKAGRVFIATPTESIAMDLPKLEPKPKKKTNEKKKAD